jgi:hypothetical protein
MINSLNQKELVDIRTVAVSKNLPKKERIIEFVRQIGDPHHFKYKEFVITTRFDPNGPPMENCLQGLMT